MNESRKDPFLGMMSRRVERVELPDLPVMEIREAPIRDVRPILEKIGEMDPTELTYRLLGLSLYVDDEQLTYERVVSMTAAMVGKLMPVMPAIFKVYGIETDADRAAKDAEEAAQAAAAEAAGEKKESDSTIAQEPSLNSPSSSTKRLAKSKET